MEPVKRTVMEPAKRTVMEPIKNKNMKCIRIVAFIVVCLAAICSARNAYAQRIAGEWSGQLKVAPQMELKLVFHIAEDAVSIDSPDQGAFGIPGDLVFLSEDSVCFKIPKIMAGFSGALKGQVLVGQFQQGGMHFPLELTQGASKANRPQTPTPPFPYTTEELKITTQAGTIAGTLTIPENADNNTPLAILVTGSGQQNRDEEIFEHKPFAVIADYLARNGVATFRYDDRGMGESTGDVLSATTADFAADAEAAVGYLRNTGRFGKTGIIGHSEGGLIAYMLGAKPNTIDFIVSVAGPSIKGSKTIGYQNKMALLKSGLPEKEADDFAKAMEATCDYKVSHPEATSLSDAQLAELYPQYKDTPLTQQLAEGLKGAISAGSDQMSNPWMMYFLAYDPASDMKKLQLPTLIIYGEKDQQVPPSLNAELARQLAPQAIVMEFPQLNHLMQHAQTGDLSEYKQIEETISPEVLAAISDFISQLSL